MQKYCVIIFVSLLCAAIVCSRSVVRTGIHECFKEECPDNTFACERLTRVSDDKKHIVSEIHCLDLEGKALKNVTNYQDNPYGPDTDFKGYNYKGAFEISLDNENDENTPKESHGKHKNTDSEVEDLNAR
ncbi:uncharacterized protein LOC108907933 isoform X2 [Anoplophora glabripennis]|uniref:uncharacterized protein LOC108907933 isoform X2 n=1 Tax=Anoplophora glabripennis TaxID=217634 RepID=UPI0008747097|nr:uncharacterized protein LOC108907933 isoform X2 [Anoplophora glabripennis]